MRATIPRLTPLEQADLLAGGTVPLGDDRLGVAARGPTERHDVLERLRGDHDAGGVDARALEIPRKMFASARKIEEGGSLTILATALVDTGSRMDELIFQEFKGTGNMELILDRKLADRRLYPALDIPKSGTRKEEKLYGAKYIQAIHKLRRQMIDTNPIEALETLTAALKKYKTNEEVLNRLL